MAALPAALPLASCAGPEPSGAGDATAARGQTSAELVSILDDIDGLTFSGVGGSATNVKGNTGFTVEVTLEPGYALEDPTALVTFLTEAAWSVNDSAMPTTTVEISYHGMPGEGIDLAASAQEDGWVASDTQTGTVAPNGFSRVSIPVADHAVDQGVPETVDRLGEWPGEPPAVPDGLTSPREG